MAHQVLITEKSDNFFILHENSWSIFLPLIYDRGLSKIQQYFSQEDPIFSVLGLLSNYLHCDNKCFPFSIWILTRKLNLASFMSYLHYSSLSLQKTAFSQEEMWNLKPNLQQSHSTLSKINLSPLNDCAFFSIPPSDNASAPNITSDIILTNFPARQLVFFPLPWTKCFYYFWPLKKAKLQNPTRNVMNNRGYLNPISRRSKSAFSVSLPCWEKQKKSADISFLAVNFPKIAENPWRLCIVSFRSAGLGGTSFHWIIDYFLPILYS